MFEELKQIMENAYAPYSKFYVAAIVIYNDNSKFYGVNVENISFGATNCAERTAIFKAVSEGKKNLKIKEIHILAMKHDRKKKIENLFEFTPPCGICRQVISEFSDSNTVIYEWNLNGEHKVKSFDLYFPNQFKMESLK